MTRHAAAATVALATAVIAFGRVATAQSLEERLDRTAYFEGLVDLGLAEVIDTALDRTAWDDPVAQARWRLEADRLRLERLPWASDARDAILDERAAEYERLLANATDHPDALRWPIDLATDAYFERLPIGGTDLFVFFGIAVDTDRARASSVADTLLVRTAGLDVRLDAAHSSAGHRTRHRAA